MHLRNHHYRRKHIPDSETWCIRCVSSFCLWHRTGHNLNVSQTNDGKIHGCHEFSSNTFNLYLDWVGKLNKITTSGSFDLWWMNERKYRCALCLTITLDCLTARIIVWKQRTNAFGIPRISYTSSMRSCVLVIYQQYSPCENMSFIMPVEQEEALLPVRVVDGRSYSDIL